MNSSDRISLFYSYAHADAKLRDELDKHLSLLRQGGFIVPWYDRDISAGTQWASQIDQHLNTAHIILLLISVDFLASPYIYSVEMKRALERHEAGEARVIPILLRPVAWQNAPFAQLQALPSNRKPVTSWRHPAEAFVSIVDGIRRVVDDLRKPSPQEDPIVRDAVRKLVRDSGEQIDAVKRIIEVLVKFGQEQKKISELKNVHNKLHEVEAALAPLRDWIFMFKPEEVQGRRDIDSIESGWRKVWRKIEALQHFAEQEMKYLEERLKVENDNISGPLWIVDLLNLRNDFDAEFGAWNIQGMKNISDDLLGKCRDYLLLIDNRLLLAVDQLDQLSDKILESLPHDSTTNV